MGVFSNEASDDRERQAVFYANNPGATPPQFDQAVRGAYAGDGQGDRSGDRMASMPPSDISTRIVDYYQPRNGLIGTDRQQEEVKPIHTVQKFDTRGNRVGTSEYVYHNNERYGALMDGYVDRDARGNVTEFAVRKPKIDKDQKDVFMVFRPTPGHPIDEQQMQHVMELLRTDLPADQRLANQAKLNAERPMEANLVKNSNNQITAVDLDPQTGQRFVVRDMRVDPVNGRKISDGPNPVLCWDGPNKTTYRYPVANMTQQDQADLNNAKWHGNMREPLRFLYEGGQPVRRRGPNSSQGYDQGPGPSERERPMLRRDPRDQNDGYDPNQDEPQQPILRNNRMRR